MRDFSVVQTRFWIDPAMRALSRDSGLIALYLATGPHTTMLGCFRCPKNYVAEDLGFSLAEVEAGFAALITANFLTFDEATGWCTVHDFLKWNPIHNTSHAMGIEKLFGQVPPGPAFKKLCAVLEAAPKKHWRSEFIQAIAALNPGCGDPAHTLSTGSGHKDTETETEKDTDTEREQDTEKDVYLREKTSKEQEEKRGVLQHIVARTRPDENLLPPVLAVFDFWKASLGHPQAVLDSKRKQLIQQALQSGYTTEQLCEAIRGCSVTPHNMGKNDRGQRYDGLHVILKDADQIDRFIRNAQSPPRERNAAQVLLDSNIAVCQDWLHHKQQEEGNVYEA